MTRKEKAIVTRAMNCFLKHDGLDTGMRLLIDLVGLRSENLTDLKNVLPPEVLKYVKKVAN